MPNGKRVSSTNGPRSGAKAQHAAALATCVATLASGCDNSGRPLADLNALGAPYVVAWRTAEGTASVTYVAPVSSLASNVQVAPSRALQVAGAAQLFPSPERQHFLLASGEAPTLEDYAVTNARQLVLERSTSLETYGVVAPLSGPVVEVDDGRSVYLDEPGLQLVELDPLTMRLGRAIALPAELVRAGYTAELGEPVARGHKVLIPVSWVNEAFDQGLDEAALVSVDLDTGRATHGIESRCPATTSRITTPAGDTYLFSSLDLLYLEKVLGTGRNTCALRIQAGEEVFDPTFVFEAADLGTPQTIAVEARGGGSRVWVRVLDEALYTPAPGDEYEAFESAPAWRLGSFDITNVAAGLVLDASPPARCCGRSLPVGGAPHTLLYAPDGSSTTLLDVSGGSPVERLTVPGLLAGVLRIQ
jgi:hypothetical protein